MYKKSNKSVIPWLYPADPGPVASGYQLSACACGEVLLRGGPGATAAVRSRLVILMLIASVSGC